MGTATLLDAAREAARLGGDILREGFGKVGSTHIGYKGEIDLVTVYDRRSEEAIVGHLQSHFPHHQVLAEEGTSGGADADHRWIVDPLDGTSNFAHGYPCFAVSIAYEHRGELALGIIFDPTRGDWFESELGAGARLNGAPLHVSETPDLLHSILATGFPYDRTRMPTVLAQWGRFILATQAVRRDGSAALDLAYVAAGRFDGFWEGHLSAWDMAAGMLMVAEAGGKTTDYDGQPHTWSRRDLVASNGRIHDTMLGIIAERTS